MSSRWPKPIVTVVSDSPDHVVRERTRVLVVDDDIDTASLMCDALRVRGFEAVELHCADDCLACMRIAPATVVITDLQMPGMSGLELTTALQAGFPGVAIVIVTGHGTAGLDEEARNAGAFHLLRKPVRVQVLVETVNRAIAQ